MENGWIFLDKPVGVSSTHALSKVRRLLNLKKVGHGGTLDPLASGLLPIAVGEATKLISYIFDSLKVYHFTVRWGQETTTGDQEGEVTFTSDKRPSLEEIQSILPKYEGKIDQVPPLYSALKVGGKRAYSLAREGSTLSLPSRPVYIKSLTLDKVISPELASFHVCCGKGTYVRSLGRDLGRDLGGYGSIESLRRVEMGKFSIKDAISLDNLENSGNSRDGHYRILPMGAVLDDIPAVSLQEPYASWLHQGRKIPFLEVNPIGSWDFLTQENIPTIVCLREDGTLLGISRLEEGMIIPQRNFNIELKG
jgi:tRNA pseudouridine55 synthase